MKKKIVYLDVSYEGEKGDFLWLLDNTIQTRKARCEE